MSLQTRLEALALAIGTDVKSILSRITALEGKSDPWTTQILTTAVTNSTTTAADVLTGFTPEINTRYWLDCKLVVQSAAATTGVQTAIVGPTSGVSSSAIKTLSAASASTDLLSHAAVGTFNSSVNNLTTPNVLTIEGLVVIGSSVTASMNIRPQVKSETSLVTVTVLPGSHMRWRKV